jgi:hypothetical protein
MMLQMAVLAVLGWLGVAYIVLAVVEHRTHQLGHWTR